MKQYTNAQIAKVVKYIIENVEMLNNALDDALRVTEIEQQNKRYRAALEEIAQKRMTYADMAGVLLIARKALNGDNDE